MIVSIKKVEENWSKAFYPQLETLFTNSGFLKLANTNLYKTNQFD
jgi:hypothetical protein